MKLRIAVIGCGGICNEYGRDILNHHESLTLIGATDLDLSRAETFCQRFGGRVYADLDEILDDLEVDVVLNLTIHKVHFELNRRALSAGKHVFSEKPMALTHVEAKELGDLARKTNCRIAAAPITFLGEGIQTVAKLLKKDLIGHLRLVYAEVNWGQINRWIPAPASYFAIGPLLDVGVYAITALTFLLGPVRKVWGYSTILQNPRIGTGGQEFPVTAPDFTMGMLEFESGVVARVTTNYYVPTAHQRHLRGFEFHGDEGTLSISDYHDFSAICQLIPYGEPGVNIPLLREPDAPMDRAIGLVELAQAIRDDRPHQGSAEHAAHVIEIMEGLQISADRSEKKAIHSRFAPSPLVEWARDLEPVIAKKD